MVAQDVEGRASFTHAARNTTRGLVPFKRSENRCQQKGGAKVATARRQVRGSSGLRLMKLIQVWYTESRVYATTLNPSGRGLGGFAGGGRNPLRVRMQG